METTGTNSSGVIKVRRRWEKREGEGRQWSEAARWCTDNQTNTNGTDSGEEREVLRQWIKGGGEGQCLSVAATVTAAPPGPTATGTNTETPGAHPRRGQEAVDHQVTTDHD